MAIEPIEIAEQERKRVTRPRPGHADLAGALKHDADDARDILERASARETTARVAVGAVCKRFLREFDVHVASHTVALDRKSTRLNSSHGYISYAVFCLKKKKKKQSE